MLKKQWLKSGWRFFNTGKEAPIRLMTPLGLKYNDAYAQAFPVCLICLFGDQSKLTKIS